MDNQSSNPNHSHAVNRMQAALEEFREKYNRERDQQIADIHRLVDALPMPEPGAIDSPDKDQFFQRIFWTDKECDAVFHTAVRIKEQYCAERNVLTATLPNKERVGLLIKISKAIMARFLPAHRQRVLGGMETVPASHRPEVIKAFDIEDKAEPATADPLAVNTPQKEITWTPQEGYAILVHLCHLMHKQGWRHIPDISDSLGSAMFQSFMEQAQALACREGRRRSITRAIITDAGLMPRLEPMLKAPQLPALPPPPKSLEQILVETEAQKSTNGHTAHGMNGNSQHAPEPAVIVPPLPELPKVDAFEKFSDAELLQAATMRVLGRLSELDAFKKHIEEVEAFNKELIDSDSATRSRVSEISRRLLELEETVRELSKADRAHTPRVAIVGCRKDEFDQVTALARERGLNLVFKHYDQDGKIQRVYGDYAIMMKWVSHAWEDNIKASGIPRDRYAFITGGAGKVVSQMEVWFTPEVVGA